MTDYDDLGRTYKTRRYAVDPSDGTVGNCLAASTPGEYERKSF